MSHRPVATTDPAALSVLADCWSREMRRIQQAELQRRRRRAMAGGTSPADDSAFGSEAAAPDSAYDSAFDGLSAAPGDSAPRDPLSDFAPPHRPPAGAGR